MASSDQCPGATPCYGGGGPAEPPPGKATTVGSHVLDMGAQMIQSMRPVKQIQQHVCTFALYAHDLSRQIETHHYLSRLSQDFLQLFEGLPAEEQKLWHSHAYEVKTGLWVNPRVPEMIQKTELENLARTYGKFWCTWQVDRGDRLPLGAPALMMSPQGVNAGAVRPDMVKARDDKYGISSEEIGKSRVEIGEPEWINPQADYWKQHGKGFAVDVVRTEMKTRTPFP
ncbi:hypothetical protein QJS10_CPB20g01736 [Acorus calamus]|uniref:Uncharacterized protein n=1 Tax=Acorus calamus TaxID=4465 RepID=A0AAV9CC71_ACOCL|nr:hypothetical protein QJS10_CPB20g01736 [Acorus calamus]